MWCKCICANYGANITAIEFLGIENHVLGVTVLTNQAYGKTPRKFDLAVSTSSIEQKLGRLLAVKRRVNEE